MSTTTLRAASTPAPAGGPPKGGFGGRLRTAALRFAVFLVVAVSVSLVRFRCSPLYPADNDVNSDVYVYQAVGNGWRHGRLPYEDVFDVKGPLVYLLFRGFAEVRPFSMGPPLLLLCLLTLASLFLAEALARLWVRSAPLAGLSAVLACLLVYLSPSGVVSSFTCEELAVPGVLLLVWLSCRCLLGQPVRRRWWLLSGTVLGLLFWAKFLVVAPWPAMLVACGVLVVLGRLRARALGRVVVLHAAGFGLATVVVLVPYAALLPQVLRAYFLAKGRRLGLGSELPAEAEFARTLLHTSTAAGLTLLAVLLVLASGLRRVDRRVALPVLIAYVLSVWASLALVRHTNNLFVPLAFTAVAVPWVLAAAATRGRAVGRVGAGALVALTVLAVAGPLARSVTEDHLLTGTGTVRCRDLTTGTASWVPGNRTTVFAQTAHDEPILSPGTLLSARTAFASRQVVDRPFQFVDRSWAARVGADVVQERYVQDRTFPYVWLHVVGLRTGRDLDDEVAAGAASALVGRPGLGPALQVGYRPVLACGNDLLLQAR